jgi:uncharacterized membrane protein
MATTSAHAEPGLCDARSNQTQTTSGNGHKSIAQDGNYQNVSKNERLVSLAAGSIVATLGVGRRDLTGLLIAGVGAGLIYRGATGHCHMYEALGVDTGTAERDSRARKAHAAQSFSINRSAEDLYSYWRNLENLPAIMSHLESVRVIDDRRSHWVAKAPRIAGGRIEWDAEITEDESNRRIAWRSLAGAGIENSGSVEFIPLPNDRGTAVRVVMDYAPPAGQLTMTVAKLLGQSPGSQIREDLRKFKRVMELGEIPTIDGQPRGTCLGRGKRYFERLMG